MAEHPSHESPSFDASIQGSWILEAHEGLRWFVGVDGAEVTSRPALDTDRATASISATGRDLLALLLGRRCINEPVVGSVARGDATEDSDIDLLVDFEPDSSLFDVVHLTEELEQLLGHPVDVVSTGGLEDRDTRILAAAVDL